jgi:hypothetical protein
MPRIILTPTKLRTRPRPYLSSQKRSMTFSSRKNIERRPMMAHMLLVKTMNGSVVMPKIAGIESIANTTSAVSTISRVTNRVVA